MTGLLIIDMQAGLFTPETPRYDAEGVVARINEVAHAVRQSGGVLVFVQHDGPPGDSFEPGMPGWHLLLSLEHGAHDVVVHKTASDSFYQTELAAVLGKNNVRRLVVTGCATEFCVDTTVRAAMSREYDLLVVSDGHTTAGRQCVDARTLIQHQNWLWRELIHPKVKIDVLPARKVIARLTGSR